MKKLLSSLVIFTLIISSFSCMAFADGEKNWLVPFEDFSTEPTILSGDISATAGNSYKNNLDWFGYGKLEWDSENEVLNIHTPASKNQTIGYSFYDDTVMLDANSEKQYLVFKFLMKDTDKERVSLILPTGGTTSTPATLMEISGMTVLLPQADKKNGFEDQLVADNYYGDGWLDTIAVVELTYDADSAAASSYNENLKNYPIVIYANGKTSGTRYLYGEFSRRIDDKGVCGFSMAKQWTHDLQTKIDDVGMYIVKDSEKPVLTASVNNFTVTTSNEVPLALLANGNLSKIKANGKYLPLEAIKANKGGLSFEIDEDYLTVGENIIDLSEVKDILGTSISGTTTFTMTKELKEKEVPSTIGVSYNDKKGANTVTSRFFAPITSLDFAKVVFEISTIFEETPYTWEVELDEVYENVTVNDTVYSKTGAYVVTAALGDVPSDFDGDFEVNAYAVDFEGNSVPLN